jgi:hypothetical protein
MGNTNSIFDLVREAGIDFDSRESSLHIPVNDKSRAIMEAYQFKDNVTTFMNSIDGKQWYDIRFAYEPWWERAWTGD